MRLFVRRAVLEPQTGRGDAVYIVFREGELCSPVAILTELEASGLFDELGEQLEEETKGAKG